MNKRLKPVFEIILPALERAGIKCMVYGGIAIAGVKGEWLRENPDVDVFILDHDFKTAEKILVDLAKINEWTVMKDEQLVPGRPKIDLFFKNEDEDFFSIVTVSEIEEGNIKFKFYNSEKIFSKNILIRKLRTVKEVQFFTPEDRYIKDLFIHRLENLGARLKEDKFDKYKVDSQFILNSN